MRPSDILYKLKHKRPTLRQVSDFAMRRALYRFGSSWKMPPPLRVFINLNNNCNAKCQMCDVGQGNENSLFYRTMVQDGSHGLSPDKLEEMLAELTPFKPLIAFNGVEPTLYKGLAVAIKSAKNKGMATQVTTNGILLPKLADDLFDAGTDTLWVSLDGPPETHDAIRGIPGAFNKAMEGLKELHSKKSRAGVKKPSLNIVSTIFHLNQSAIYQLLEILQKSGVLFDEVMLQHLQFITPHQASAHNRDFPDVPVTAISTASSHPASVDINALYQEKRKIDAAGFGLNVRWKPHLKDISEMERYYRHPEIFFGDKKCRVFWNELQILADGSVTGSQRCFSLKLGNINEKPFMEIWNGPEMVRWRTLLKQEGALPACSRCCSIL